MWRVLAVVGLAAAPSLSWALGLPAPGRAMPLAPPVPPAVADIRHVSAYEPHPSRAPAQGTRERRTAASVSLPQAGPGPLGATGVPPTALLAYQRSASVVDAAVASCHLDWTLLAAIGEVESDHGQAGGSHLDVDGVASPPIIGLRLDGRGGTSRVRDTDAGHLDGDPHFDHAVGPMQFLPSTWSAVAVDGDEDGRRRVQDIDDAALGSAVYLCAGGDDLSTNSGERAALLRYNHSTAYVGHVLAVAKDIQLSAVGVLMDDVPPAGGTTRAAPSAVPEATVPDPSRPVATAEIRPARDGDDQPCPTPVTDRTAIGRTDALPHRRSSARPDHDAIGDPHRDLGAATNDRSVLDPPC